MKGMRLARPLRDNPLGAFNVRNKVSERDNDEETYEENCNPCFNPPNHFDSGDL